MPRCSLPKKFKRSYLQSWNFTLQKEFGWGLVAQASYIGTREINKLGYLDINSGQVIGAGNAGRLLNAFGDPCLMPTVVVAALWLSIILVLGILI